MLKYRRSLSAASALLAICLVFPTVARADPRVELTSRFCQTVDDYGVYVLIMANGFPANASGSVTYAIPELGPGYVGSYSIETDRRGRFEASLGFGLSGPGRPPARNRSRHHDERWRNVSLRDGRTRL